MDVRSVCGCDCKVICEISYLRGILRLFGFIVYLCRSLGILEVKLLGVI